MHERDARESRARSRRVAAAAIVVAVALLAGACQSGVDTSTGSADVAASPENKGIVESTDKPVTGGKIVYGLVAETNGWNPGANQWAASGLQVAHAIFDTLTAFDDQGEIHPFLAEHYEASADLTEWTFTLRAGIRFSNGRPVTADAVVRNQRYLQKSAITGGAYYYTESFAVKDERTFTVKTRQPWASFPMVFSTQVGVVADPDWLESNDGLRPVGTGPFVLKEWELGHKLIASKNPDYWQHDAEGTALPYLDTVEFRVLTDDDSRGAALKASDIDVMESYSGLQVQSFQRLDDYQVLADTKGEKEEMFIQLNVMAAPLDDPDARRALAYATDKAAVIDVMTGGFNEPANGPFARSSPWFADSGYPQYDPAKAKELVEQVKARHGGSFAFTFTGAAQQESTKLQQLLQQQWQEVGIDVTLESVEQAALIIKVVSGQYQATSWLQFGAPNPTLDSVWWAPEIVTTPPDFTLNFARNKDEQIGVAMKAARATADPAAFRAQMAILQQRLAADIPYLWLYHQEMAVIASKRLVNLKNWKLPDGTAGIALNQGAHPLYQVWLRDETKPKK